MSRLILLALEKLHKQSLIDVYHMHACIYPYKVEDELHWISDYKHSAKLIKLPRK